MRGVFSGVALILVLVVVGMTALKQLKTSAPTPLLQQPQQIAQDVNKALEQGAARTEEAVK